MGKVLQFKPQLRVVRPSQKDDFKTRMARIKASLEKINQLMGELKGGKTHKEGPRNT